MPQVSHFVEFCWVTSPLVQIALALVMLRNRLHRQFPMFYAYCWFRSSTALLIFFIYAEHAFVGRLYGYATLVHDVGCIVLRFAVIYELFVVLFHPYHLLRNRAQSLFRWGTALLLLVGVLIALTQVPGPYGDVFNTGFNLMDRTVDIIQCGLLFVLLVGWRYLQLSWRSFAFGIAVGLGIFAAADLAGSALILQAFHVPQAQLSTVTSIVNTFGMAAYLLSTIIWLTYAFVPESTTKGVAEIPEHDLQAWHQEFRHLVQR